MSTTLPDNWLDLAATHGATKWVKQFIQTYLPQLNEEAIAPQQFALYLADELDSRGLITLAQQKNYRSNVVQALKVIDESHPAIALVSPTTEEYRDLNEVQRGRLAERETKYFTSATADALVSRATALLDSAEWSDVGAGLAVLVGRRISEILLSEFSLRSAWSLSFGEMAKKTGAEGVTIEVPTLAPAEVVLRAIERLQRVLRLKELKLSSLSPKMAKQRVNGRYSEAVASKCVEHFSDLVPARSGREDVYTHVFRAVYATIAAHWFCPPNVPEYNFKAEIQGHFTLTRDGRKLPNYSARVNYDDYAIGTVDGNRDGQLGIKLGQLPGLEVIEAFSKPLEDKPLEETTKTRKVPAKLVKQALAELESLDGESLDGDRAIADDESAAKPKTKMRRLELRAEDVEAMVSLMARRGVMGSEREVFQVLVEVFQAGEVERQQRQVQTVQELTGSLNWFTKRIDALEESCERLQGERDRLMGEQITTDELGRLREENVRLRRELQQTQSRLEGIQKLLGGEMGAEAREGTTTATKSEVPVRRGRGETVEKLNQIVDALIAWNTSQESGDSQLRISIPTIKGLASAMGANYQKAIQQVLKERAGELEELHKRLLIGTRHNAGVFKKNEILRAIAQDYLGIDNWNEVRYIS